ncbi:MAG: hypothetical protein NW224_02920 [Leptolyngbyaceae cyanobacterium bins.302]|nr:hypothetical protein [Leptolyngbyaceae cyanobacterium bins.302]
MLFRIPKQAFKSELFYQLIAIGCLTLLLIKAAFSVDMNWDTWAYRNPFIARLWGIVTSEQYLMPSGHEERFKGFPLAAEFLQGFFWKISGRIEAINLLGIFSFFAYILFIWNYLKIPFYASVIALLAVPLIQLHATSAYIDLFANLCISAFLVLVYIMSFRRGELNARNLLLLILLGILAGNAKFQVMPTLLIGYFLFILRIFLMKDESWLGNFSKQALTGLILIGLVLSFGVIVKNSILYSNPFYPIDITVGFLHFKGPEAEYSIIPKYLKNLPRTIQWFLSVTEIDFLIRKLWQKSSLYNLDMNTGDEVIGNAHVGGRTGGFFGPYVIFQLCLLFYYSIIFLRQQQYHQKQLAQGSKGIHENDEKRPLFIVFALLTLFSSFLPQSIELRYYLYWVIILITINLYLSTYTSSFFNLQKLNFASMLFLILVTVITGFNSFHLNLVSFESFRINTLDAKILTQVKATNQPVCLAGYYPSTFLYAAPFNDGNYILQDGWNDPQTYCNEGYHVIANPDNIIQTNSTN